LYRLTPFRPLFLVFFACLSAARAAGPAANGLPPWLHLGVEFRGRFEALTALDFVRDNNNIYYLHRIRGTIGIQPAPWLRFLVQPQNVRAPFHRKPVPSNVQDTFDFHQWFGELRKNDWQVRVGRQEINFGAQRLIGSANWGNSSRSYEGIRATRTRNRVQLDAFASMVAVVDNTRLNPVLASGNQIHGVHLSAARSPREGVFESYAFWKISNTETFQDRRGRTSHFTNGLRALGKLPRRFDYNLEMAFQAGELAGQTHRAWAGYWNLGYTLASAERSPRLVAIYSFASGDNRAADGRSGTFDQLYPTNHAFYGWGDRIGWRNVHEAAAALILKPARPVTVNLEFHSFWLATRADAYYNFAGRPVAWNPDATSSHLDYEIDVNTVWNVNRRLQFIIGYVHLFPGAFLKQSTPGSPATVAYAQWVYRF
jgi:hypothetical protein